MKEWFLGLSWNRLQVLIFNVAIAVIWFYCGYASAQKDFLNNSATFINKAMDANPSFEKQFCDHPVKTITIGPLPRMR